MDKLDLSPDGMKFWVKRFGGDYAKRRKTNVLFSIRSKIETYGTYWDGGSKNEYYTITKTGVIAAVPCVGPAPFDNRPNPVIELTDDLAVVMIGFFCGKPSTPHIYVKNKDGWTF